jgi:hypothetical protein
MLRCHSRTAACAVSLPLLKPRTQMNTVLCAGAFWPQTPDNRRWTSDGLKPSFHRNHVVQLFYDNRLPFCSFVHALRPLDELKMQQFLTVMQDGGHLGVEWCTKTTPSRGNSRDLELVICRKSSRCPNHLLTPFIQNKCIYRNNPRRNIFSRLSDQPHPPTQMNTHRLLYCFYFKTALTRKAACEPRIKEFVTKRKQSRADTRIIMAAHRLTFKNCERGWMCAYVILTTISDTGPLVASPTFTAS